MPELMKEFRFEASHILPKHPGKCSRLHGHSWVLRVFVDGEIDLETGFVKDYAEISSIVKPLVDTLDHRHLGAWNQISYVPDFATWAPPGLPMNFYPSSENLIVWIGHQLAGKLNWSKLELMETCTSLCTLTRREFNGDNTHEI